MMKKGECSHSTWRYLNNRFKVLVPRPTTLKHRLVFFTGTRKQLLTTHLFVDYAGSHQAGVYMGVDAEAVLPRKFFDKVEGLLKLVHTSMHFD